MAFVIAKTIPTKRATTEDAIFIKSATVAEAVLATNVTTAFETALIPFSKELTTAATSFAIAEKTFEKKAAISVGALRNAFLTETAAFVTALAILTKNVAIAFAIERIPRLKELTIAVTKLTKPVITEVTNFMTKDSVLTKKAFMEARMASIAFFIEIMAFTIARATFTKNALMVDAILTKNALMARMTVRKNCLIEAIIEVINLTKPFTKDLKNFLIDFRSFKKKVCIETKIAIKAALMATGIFLTADIISTKNFLTARMTEVIDLTNPFIKDIKNFLIEVRRFMKNEVMEEKVVNIPFLTKTMVFLMGRNSIRGKENEKAGLGTITFVSFFTSFSGTRIEASLSTTAAKDFLFPLSSVDFK